MNKTTPEPSQTQASSRDQRVVDAVVASYLHDISARHSSPQSGYSSLRKSRGSSGTGLGVRASRNA
jgi:hypothetical protein